MNFCENCHLLIDTPSCHVCGNKNLRQVSNEDFCYFNSLDSLNYEMFEATLKDNNIEVVCMPYYPKGVTHFNAGRAEGRRVYVHYKDIAPAKEVYETLFGLPTNKKKNK